MREHIARGLVGLAVVLLAVDLVLFLPRLLAVAKDSPEAALLAGGLACLLGALWVRQGGRRKGEGAS